MVGPERTLLTSVSSTLVALSRALDVAYRHGHLVIRDCERKRVSLKRSNFPERFGRIGERKTSRGTFVTAMR